MNLFFSALGLALFFEGLIYFGFPASMRAAALYVAAMDERSLRGGGFVLMCAGFGILYAVLS